MINPVFNFYRFPASIPLIRGLGLECGIMLSYILARFSKLVEEDRAGKHGPFYINIKQYADNLSASDKDIRIMVETLEEQGMLRVIPTPTNKKSMTVILQWETIDQTLEECKFH